MLKTMLVIFCLTMTLCQLSIAAATGGYWDDARYIDLDQLKPGMKGYGLTVFKGTQVERFEVEVVSVMKNYQMGRDYFLILCHDKRFELANGTEGVSGSPVYFEGKLAGAMSFGWEFGSEPLYGVTPIRDMLEVSRTGDLPRKLNNQTGGRSLDKKAYASLMSRELLSREQLAAVIQSCGLGLPGAPSGRGSRLPTAIHFSGINEKTAAQLSRLLPGINLQSGAGGQIANPPVTPVKLEPGAALVVPLIMGDFNGSVLGTVTEVRGDSIWAFGHPWNGDGQVWYPIGTGAIHTFVNSMNMSFKLGSLIEVVGALKADEMAAVYGKIGEKAAMAPCDLSLNWKYNQMRKDFHIEVIRQRELSAILAGMVVEAGLGYAGGLPQEVTVRYDMEIKFEGLAPLRFGNAAAAQAISDIFQDIMPVILMVTSNPWKRVELERMSFKAEIDAVDTAGYLVSSQINRTVFKPGETVRVALELEPDYGARQTCVLQLDLPKNLAAGSYQICAGGADLMMQQYGQAQPWLNDPANLESVMDVLKLRQSIRRDYLYLSMILPDESVALEGRPLAGLPGGRIEMLSDPRRQNILTPHRTLIKTDLKTNWVVLGETQWTIEVQP